MVTVTKESRATLRTSLGNMVLEFIADKAPRTCENFASLGKKGFYDGTTFHRIIKDFMVQGGCPHGNGKGGPGYTIRPEFNDTPHVPGVLSMARDTDPHSAGSQFFICTSEARYLDSRYTAFARVIEGMDVLEKLGAVSTDIQPKYQEKSVPRDPVYINGIEFEGVDFTVDEPAQSNGEATASDQGEKKAEGSDSNRQGGGEGSSSGGRRSRRGRGRRGKGGGDRNNSASDRGGDRSSNDGQGSSSEQAPASEAKSNGSDDQPKSEKPKAEKPKAEKPKASDKSAADGAPAAEAKAEAKPAAKKATRKKATRKKAVAKSDGDAGGDEKPKAPARKKAVRKKAVRKKPASDDAPKSEG